MELEAIWEKFAIACYQVWVWLKCEASIHPYLTGGIILVFILAWTLYKMEIKAK
jgi:drug/metabolite transporter superfamily protein YnfA